MPQHTNSILYNDEDDFVDSRFSLEQRIGTDRNRAQGSPSSSAPVHLDIKSKLSNEKVVKVTD